MSAVKGCVEVPYDMPQTQEIHGITLHSRAVKDLAMHVAASKPLAVGRDGVPAEKVEQERTIAAARAAESGKPANIVEKMVEGAVAKYISEVTLLAQPFVKGDGKQTVEQLVKAESAVVHGFVLYVVGEGIEKRKDDFAAEVAAMAKA